MRTLIQASLIAAVFALPAFAADTVTSPVGLWKTIDESGKPKALVRITENQGVLQGKIEKLFRPADQDQNPKCIKCEDERKDQPIIGMTIINGLKKNGENEYGGGEILDPNNGKVYKSKAELQDGGKKLSVRGYIGVPMLGRSQVWERQE